MQQESKQSDIPQDVNLLDPSWNNARRYSKFGTHFKIYMFLVAPIIFLTVLALVFVISTYPLTSAYIAYWTDDDTAFKNALSEILPNTKADLSDSATYTISGLSDEKKPNFSQSNTSNKKIAKKNPAESQAVINKKTKTLLPVEKGSSISKTDRENHIIIPEIEIDVPFVSVRDNNEETIKDALESGVVHYANTALPGTRGTFAVTGHSSNYWWEEGKYNIAFALIEKLEQEDDIVVYYNGEKYVYKIFDKKIVGPDDESVFEEKPEKHLITLTTCWPLMTNWKRLVVWGEQVFPLPLDRAKSI